MGTNELRKRLNWQTTSGSRALKTEEIFYTSLQSSLNLLYPNKFTIEQHPKYFQDIYSTYCLPDEVLSQIYNVNMNSKKKNGDPIFKWGISMDFLIRNNKNNKILFGEIKRQDGWVENTTPSAGRGNAHERSCKYFTPGLCRALRKKGGLSDDILPFWLVLVGDITRDPKRNREIAFWFQEYTKNYFMWRNPTNPNDLLDFFENNLLQYLL